jgi:hypothetical protein
MIIPTSKTFGIFSPSAAIRSLLTPASISTIMYSLLYEKLHCNDALCIYELNTVISKVLVNI